MMKRKLMPLGLLVAFCMSAQAQETESREALFQELYVMDSLLFTAFNNRDLTTVSHIFSEELEFYHDKTGLTGYDDNLRMLGQTFERANAPTRELIKASMEVYPIPGFGAVQAASHRFCHLENGHMDCGTFKFVHVWQKKDGAWKLTRVVSFDH